LFPNRLSKRAKKIYPEEVSFAWRESKTAAEAAGRCGYTSVSAFKMYISRLRSEFGEESFPLKRASRARVVKQSPHVIDSRIKAASILWRADVATVDVADCLDMTNAELSKFIEEYRRENGLTLFPYRGLVIR
jgi:AraC-like DNA-binding protein